MNKLQGGVLLLCYTCLVIFLLIDYGKASTQTLKRTKRYLSFRNITRFFLRINFKANMVPWNQIFAQAAGFRINWDDPPDSFHPYHQISRRSLYTRLELLLDKNGLNGYHCIRRAICETEAMSKPSEIYHKVFRIIFSKRSQATTKWHDVPREDCLLSLSQCPISMLDVVQFTDV